MNNKENSEQKCIGRCDRIMRPGQLRQTLIIEINSVRFSFKAPPLVTGKLSLCLTEMYGQFIVIFVIYT